MGNDGALGVTYYNDLTGVAGEFGDGEVVGVGRGELVADKDVGLGDDVDGKGGGMLGGEGGVEAVCAH